MEARALAERLHVVPDRSVVTSPAAREALEGILAAGRHAKRFGGLDVPAARVLATLLRLYADLGEPPSPGRIALAAGLSDSETGWLLDDLFRRALVIMERPAPSSQAVDYAANRRETQRRATREREPVMKKLRFVGLDVHAETIAVAIAEQGGEVRSLGTIPNGPSRSGGCCGSSGHPTSCESATRPARPATSCTGSSPSSA